MIDLKYIFGLPPEKAVKYFESKGYTFTWDWHDIWQEAHSKAFTVAKAVRMDILQDIRDSVQTALKEGTTLQQFKKDLTPKLIEKGWWGKKLIGDGAGGAKEVQLGSPYRLKTIYQANLQTAYSADRWKAFGENSANRPYLMYVAVMDDRTRPAHAALNGKVFRIDDPFWNSFGPPNGFRCRCRVRALDESDIKSRGLGIESSKGKLSSNEVLVSKETGEMKEVAVYHDPLTGMKISPDVGWSYNPGQTAWQPDLKKYDKDIRKLF